MPLPISLTKRDMMVKSCYCSHILFLSEMQQWQKKHNIAIYIWTHSWNTVFIQPIVQWLCLPHCDRVVLVIFFCSWAIFTHWKDFSECNILPFKIYIWNSLRLKEIYLANCVTEDKGFWSQQAVWERKRLSKG